MPQLVFTDYGPQIVWLVITFVVLYLLLSKLVLPSIAGTLGERDQRLQGDIERAEKLKAEAESTLAASRKAIGEARAAAQAEITAATRPMGTSQRMRESAGRITGKAPSAVPRLRSSRARPGSSGRCPAR